MKEKLTVIGELIDEIRKSENDHSRCLQRQQLLHAVILADDVIQKLINLRNLYSNMSLGSAKSDRCDTILISSGIQHCLPYHKTVHTAQMANMKTEVALNGENSNLIEIAHNAFNNENYAKCVRTIERIATLQQSKLNPILIDLCHKSYKKVIQSAASNTDRLKLCEWWRLFVESTTFDDSSNEALLCQIDWRSECLQERLKLTKCVNERMRISELLIVSLIEAYEIATQCMPKFSVGKLRQRIDGLCLMISDYLRNFSGLNKAVSLVIEEGIELLRLIYNEAKDEFDAIVQNKPKNDDEGRNLMAIMSEITAVLRHCSWCDVSFTRIEEEMKSNRAIDQSSSDDCDYYDDVIEARF
ncbi:unnamed protein product [Litomosoides sigmodontis]|uniref:Uncharacterized protein n=1 Tax=Litomosoides sigmodontis TaxID=42156 RepID=A0A3P6UDH2_LITSI|nr:unnamed protein product [Litomosoides sigmodontis]